MDWWFGGGARRLDSVIQNREKQGEERTDVIWSLGTNERCAKEGKKKGS